MCEKFRLGGRVGTRLAERSVPLDKDLRFHHDLGSFCNQCQTNLAAAVKLDIDLCEQFGVKQRAMFRAVAAIDAIA